MKKLMMLICLLVTSFSMFACDKEQIEQAGKILVKRSNDTGETAKDKDNPSQSKDDPSQSKDDPSQPIVLSEVGKHLRAKGCDNNEIRVMQQIEKETYGPTLHPVNFTSNHFNYAGCEGQTYANCGLYASKRLLHHMGQLGHVPDDLWYRYSDEELRGFIVLATRNHERYRNQNETLSEEALHLLLIHLGLNFKQLSLIAFRYGDGSEYHPKIFYRMTHGKQSPWTEPLRI